MELCSECDEVLDQGDAYFNDEGDPLCYECYLKQVKDSDDSEENID